MNDFNELNALRGLSPRQQRFLELEAVIEEIASDDLANWHARNAHSHRTPIHQRDTACRKARCSKAILLTEMEAN